MISFFMHFNNKIPKKKGNEQFFTNISNEGGKIVMRKNYIVLGKFDITKYTKEFKTTTDIVILTKEQLEHIIDKHPEVMKYFRKIKLILDDPDIILKENNVLDTIWLIKEFSKNVKLTIKLNTIKYGVNDYKNSIIQMQFLEQSRVQKYIKNNRVSKIFEKDKVM